MQKQDMEQRSLSKNGWVIEARDRWNCIARRTMIINFHHLSVDVMTRRQCCYEVVLVLCDLRS